MTFLHSTSSIDAFDDREMLQEAEYDGTSPCVGLIEPQRVTASLEQDQSKNEDISVKRNSPDSEMKCLSERSTSTAYALTRLDRILDVLVSSLDRQDTLTIELCRRPVLIERPPESSVAVNCKEPERKVIPISFPGRNPGEAWRFTVVLRLLEIVRSALASNLPISKRDIYYCDPTLFGSQVVVDRFIDDIAFTFRMPRAALCVTAAAKGLVAGALVIVHPDRSVSDAFVGPEGALIPEDDYNIRWSFDRITFMLLVEKEATFRSVISTSFWTVRREHALLLTGKGYPDIATRQFLRRAGMSTANRQVPIFSLTDFDPDGIAIHSVYKHGSVSLQHLNNSLAIASLRRIGIGSHQVNVATQESSPRLVELSKRDRRKAIIMLEWPQIQRAGDLDMLIELQIMLLLDYKAEIEILTEDSEALEKFLEIHCAHEAV